DIEELDPGLGHPRSEMGDHVLHAPPAVVARCAPLRLGQQLHERGDRLPAGPFELDFCCVTLLDTPWQALRRRSIELVLHPGPLSLRSVHHCAAARGNAPPPGWIDAEPGPAGNLGR